MARYINADTLIEILECAVCIADEKVPDTEMTTTMREFSQVVNMCCADYLKNEPTADVAPVVHGEWIDDDQRCSHCSNCERSYDLWDNDFNFCPNCGAKMDGGI